MPSKKKSDANRKRLLDPDARAKRNANVAQYMRDRLADPEARAKRNARRREIHRVRLSDPVSGVRYRRECADKASREYYANHERRKAQSLLYVRRKLANETPAQREKRLAYARLAGRKRKAAKLLELEAMMDAPVTPAVPRPAGEMSPREIAKRHRQQNRLNVL